MKRILKAALGTLAIAFAREAGWRLARRFVPHTPPKPRQAPKRRRNGVRG